MPTPETVVTAEAAADVLIKILDATERLPWAVTLRNRTYDLLKVTAGGVVADIGCGTGGAVGELAERGATAVGVDLDERMVEVCRSRRPEADFRVADACALPFGDGELSGYRADKVYHGLTDPAAALAEARRVLAAGGRIVLAGQDWDATVIDSDRAELTRAIVQGRADTMPSPRAARAYRSMLLDAGFEDVTVEAHVEVLTEAVVLPLLARLVEAARAAGACTAEEAAEWAAEQEERARTGRLLLAFPMFVAAARRPT